MAKGIVIRSAPPRSAQIITRYRTRTVKAVKRGGRAVAKRAWERRALLASVIVGFIQAKLHESEAIPSIAGIGKNGTAALALTAAALFTRNEWVGHGAAASLAIATYELTTTGALSGDGDQGGL